MPRSHRRRRLPVSRPEAVRPRAPRRARAPARARARPRRRPENWSRPGRASSEHRKARARSHAPVSPAARPPCASAFRSRSAGASSRLLARFVASATPRRRRSARSPRLDCLWRSPSAWPRSSPSPLVGRWPWPRGLLIVYGIASQQQSGSKPDQLPDEQVAGADYNHLDQDRDCKRHHARLRRGQGPPPCARPRRGLPARS
jgi:hypothetical protein